MIRSIFISSALAILLLAPTAFGQVAASWQKVTSTDGRFTALFPAAPATSAKPVNTVSGAMQLNLVFVEVDGSAFFVSYADHASPAVDIPQALLVSQEGVVKDLNATLLSSTAVVHMGHPARDYKVRLPQADGSVFIGTVKVLIVGQRLYQIIVVQPEAKAAGDEAVRFLSSFQVKVPSGVARR